MSSNPQRKTVISELPEDVKERILERMPTRDAARCSLLSTQWRDAWHRQGRLVFDWEFFHSFKSLRNVADKGAFFVNIINSILLLRAGPPPLQSELERWCLFLSRNGVEELDLSMGSKHKLPLCLMSCKTMTQLSLADFVICLPANAGCIFLGLISLDFYDVEFHGNGNGLVNTTLPKLEKLAFLDGCIGVGNFLVSAPQLQSLDAGGCVEGVTITMLALHLISINTLYLSGNSFSDNDDVAVASAALPIAKNLMEIMLDSFSFECWNHITFLIHLLKKSPKLCVLKIDVEAGSDSGRNETNSILLEGPTEGGQFIKDDMRMLESLETVKINGFTGSETEICFLKLILSKSTALHDVVIWEAKDINNSLAFQVLKKLLSFPRASPRAKLIYKEHDLASLLRNFFETF